MDKIKKENLKHKLPKLLLLKFKYLKMEQDFTDLFS